MLLYGLKTIDLYTIIKLTVIDILIINTMSSLIFTAGIFYRVSSIFLLCLPCALVS